MRRSRALAAVLSVTALAASAGIWSATGASGAGSDPASCTQAFTTTALSASGTQVSCDVNVDNAAWVRVTINGLTSVAMSNIAATLTHNSESISLFSNGSISSGVTLNNSTVSFLIPSPTAINYGIPGTTVASGTSFCPNTYTTSPPTYDVHCAYQPSGTPSNTFFQGTQSWIVQVANPSGNEGSVTSARVDVASATPSEMQVSGAASNPVTPPGCGVQMVLDVKNPSAVTRTVRTLEVHVVGGVVVAGTSRLKVGTGVPTTIADPDEEPSSNGTFEYHGFDSAGPLVLAPGAEAFVWSNITLGGSDQTDTAVAIEAHSTDSGPVFNNGDVQSGIHGNPCPALPADPVAAAASPSPSPSPSHTPSASASPTKGAGNPVGGYVVSLTGPAKVALGKSAKLTGLVAKSGTPQVGAAVTVVCTPLGGKPSVVATTATTAGGVWSTLVKPAKRATCAATSSGATSALLTLHVTRVISLAAAKAVGHGKPITLGGRVTGGKKGEKVQLKLVVGKKTVARFTVKLDKRGFYHFVDAKGIAKAGKVAITATSVTKPGLDAGVVTKTVKIS